MTAPPITLRSPAELLAVIPHLLGFEPDHAIVVLALRDNKLGLTQRIDLPAPRTQRARSRDTLARHVLRDEARGRPARRLREHQRGEPAGHRGRSASGCGPAG